MWQLSEAIDGMGEACRALGIPVVGGNVSLYNESRGRRHRPDAGRRRARPDRPARRAAARRRRCVDGDRIVAARRDAGAELGGSEWAPAPRRSAAARLPAARPRRRTPRCTTLVRGLVADGVVARRARRAPTAGSAVALAEMAVARAASGARGRRTPTTSGCSPSRRRGSCCRSPEAALAEVLARAGAAGVAGARPRARPAATGSSVDGACSTSPLADADRRLARPPARRPRRRRHPGLSRADALGHACRRDWSTGRIGVRSWDP